MSKNICPCCNGKADYLDISDKYSYFLCSGCEIKLYHKLHNVMDDMHYTKEEAYQYLSE